MEMAGRTHHLDFEPRVDVGHLLAGVAHAMIDLSDGLATDLRHICKASDVAARLDVTRLPISQAAQQLSGQTGRLPWEHALTDGEDYELCFTASADVDICQRAGLSADAVRHIGEVIAGPVRLELIDEAGRTRPYEAHGWEHGGAGGRDEQGLSGSATRD